MKNIIFGNGDFADILSEKLESQGINIYGYTVNQKWLESESYHEKTVIAFEELDNEIDPAECNIYIGVIGKHMFQLREQICQLIIDKGYKLPNFISKSAQVLTKHIGYGNIIMENAVIEAHCKIGNGNIIWPNVVLPHHNEIGDFNNLSPSVSFSGYAKIGNRCFIGNNACLNNRVMIKDRALVGAGVFVQHDLGNEEVLVSAKSYVLPNKKSYDFK
ncbi:MAG: hypothetical protein NC394_03245 [Bacteroides sp.]|nr:hypothetical protein [Bacteroides sp.]